MLTKMKELTIDTRTVSTNENVNALTEQVNDLQKRYYRSLAPDCEVRTAADRWYLTAIATACAGLVFPPAFIATAVCVYRAKKKGGKR
ncbi:MAG: hypothetical protein Q4D56_12810 [Bacteroides sp.]|nr:hypothetical protein [Bacteroides sp.]